MKTNLLYIIVCSLICCACGKTNLLEKAYNQGINIIPMPVQYVMISLSGGILFDSGSADIKKGASMIIGRVGDILKNYSNKRIKIEGHTDNVPIGSTSKYSSNWELSTARATSVLQYLAQKKGLNAKYLEASGRADVNPVADNKTEKGRSKNRRVEIKIYSNND